MRETDHWVLTVSSESGETSIVRARAVVNAAGPWVDILGALVFLLPTCAILAWLSWPFFMQSFNVDEHSSNAGGLLRWPIKLVLPEVPAMLQLAIRSGTAFVLVTHDIAVARLLAHRMVVMQRGRVVESGLTDQVLDDPQHPYTQLLVSSVLQP